MRDKFWNLVLSLPAAVTEKHINTDNSVFIAPESYNIAALFTLSGSYRIERSESEDTRYTIAHRDFIKWLKAEYVESELILMGVYNE